MSCNHTEHEKLRENVSIFYIGFDIDADGHDDGELYQVNPEFRDELFKDIISFAFGTDRAKKRGTDPSEWVAMYQEATRKLYEIPSVKEASDFYTAEDDATRASREKALKKNPDTEISGEEIYTRRGEFGELMLYHWLHEYYNADALISKIYFKDSKNIPAHGFDAVHVNVDTHTLWLGESKLYKNGTSAINALTSDLEEHFNRDFFNDEFTIISNHVTDEDINDPFIEKLLDPDTKVLDKLANINVALFVGFESDTIKSGFSEQLSDSLKSEVETMVAKANEKFSQHSWIKQNRLNWYLFLFPYDDKNLLVKNLHLKLKGAQQR